MGLISFTHLVDGSTSVAASATNTPLDTIYNEFNGNITDANLSSSAAIAQSKLSLALTGAQSATVATSETSGSSTYADLATTTDTVTVTIGASGMALVALTSYLFSNAAQGIAYCSFAASGANTIAASDSKSISHETSSADTAGDMQSSVFLLTALAAGSTTFKLKYRGTAGTLTFANRSIAVIPL